MTSPADRSILALRATHDELAAVVTGLSDDELTGPSGASEWTVAQVLSHLGSGAEISLATVRAALGTVPPLAPDFNQSVWDRWNALSPQQQSAGFLTADEELLTTLEALSSDTRQALHIDLGFLPAPVPLATLAGMRLNEAAQHSWDVRVSTDPAAAIATDTATVLADHFAGDLGFLLGFSSKPDALANAAVVDIESSGFTLAVADTVTLTTAASQPTAVFSGPLEAFIRLLGGRLTPRHTADDVDVEVTGNVTLDDLRRVFPGY